MEYLKCLGVGIIIMVLGMIAMMVVSCVVMVGMIGLEWFLGLFGARIVLPPGVSRGTVVEPIIWIFFGLIVLPCFGWCVREVDKLSRLVGSLSDKEQLLMDEVGRLKEELASKTAATTT